MIGYLKPDFKGKSKEYKRTYKLFYCSLCKALKSQYNYIGVLNLNYEITAFIILLSGLKNEKEKVFHGSCSISPFIPVRYVDYYQDDIICVANLAALIVYYEIIDNLSDENKVKWKIIDRLMLKTYKKAIDSVGQRFFDIDNAVSNYYKLEKNSEAKIEDILEHEGNMIEAFLSVLINCYDFETSSSLLKLSNLLGQWIFLIDACDDIDEDIKKSTFNPILLMKNKSNIQIVINKIETEISSIVHNLPIKCYKELIEFLFIDNLKQTSSKYSEFNGNS